MAALGALDHVRRKLLARAATRDSDVNELRLAGTLSAVSKHLRDRTSQRCLALLSGVEPKTLDNPTGLAAVWELCAKATVSPCLWQRGASQSHDVPLSRWRDVVVPRTGSLEVELRFTNNNINPARLEALVDKAQVVKLDLHYTRVTIEGIKALTAGGASLHTLLLAHSPGITDHLLGLWSALPSLVTLDLTGSDGVTDEGVASLLFTCQTLKHLSLASCSRLTDLPTSELRTGAYFEPRAPTLLSLNLRFCHMITNETMLEIVRGQPFLRKLTIGGGHNTTKLQDLVRRRNSKRHLTVTVPNWGTFGSWVKLDPRAEAEAGDY